MQLGPARLTPFKKSRHMQEGLILYCRQSGPLISLCPVRPKGGDLPEAVGTLVSSTPQFPTPQFPDIFSFKQVSWELQAYINSRAEENFFNEALAQQIGIPQEALPSPLLVNALDGWLLFKDTHHSPPPIHFLLSGNYRESVSFHLISFPNTTLILRHPWLSLHNLGRLGFQQGDQLEPSLPPALPLLCQVSPWAFIYFIILKRPRFFHSPCSLPQPGIGKKRTLSLPPHHPFDCAINLLPQSSLPSSHS